MPQRFLRPGIRTSERWNSISRNAQALYLAILTVVDDYGRYDGRPSVLHGDAFSVWNELNPKLAVNPQETAALCCELQTRGLVMFYEVGGKRCLQMRQWEERIRDGAKEKWPKPNESDTPQESAGFRCVPLPPSSPSSSPSSSPPSSVGDLIPAVKTKKYPEDCYLVLEFLNKSSGKKFRETEVSLNFIKARLAESGVDLDGVEKMVKRQCALWLGTPQAEYLRPETLFNKTKFDAYYAAKDVPITNGNLVLQPDYDKGF